MNDTQDARERLEALLTGLEDEVMCGEGCVDTDVAAMRAEIEGLIEKHVGAKEVATIRAGDVKGRVSSAVERIGKWAGVGQRGERAALVPRLRMAFSGTKPDQQGQQGSEGGAGNRDRKQPNNKEG